MKNFSVKSVKLIRLKWYIFQKLHFQLFNHSGYAIWWQIMKAPMQKCVSNHCVNIIWLWMVFFSIFITRCSKIHQKVDTKIFRLLIYFVPIYHTIPLSSYYSSCKTFIIATTSISIDHVTSPSHKYTKKCISNFWEKLW